MNTEQAIKMIEEIQLNEWVREKFKEAKRILAVERNFNCGNDYALLRIRFAETEVAAWESVFRILREHQVPQRKRLKPNYCSFCGNKLKEKRNVT